MPTKRIARIERNGSNGYGHLLVNVVWITDVINQASQYLT